MVSTRVTAMTITDSYFAEPHFRDHAFLTGFVAEMFASSRLPDELQEWIWLSGMRMLLIGKVQADFAALSEPRIPLANAYIEMLKVSSLPKSNINL